MRMILAILTLASLTTCATYAADAKAGQAIYDKSCKGCHGADGTPNAAIGKAMKVDMKDLKAPDVQATSDADIAKIITMGKGKMHPVASVTGANVDNVVAYVKTLKK